MPGRCEPKFQARRDRCPERSVALTLFALFISTVSIPSVMAQQSKTKSQSNKSPSGASKVVTAGCKSCNQQAGQPTSGTHTDQVAIAEPGIATSGEIFSGSETVEHDWSEGAECDTCHTDDYAISECDGGVNCNSGGGLFGLWSRLSVRAEVPLFWRKGHTTPALVTTSPQGTAADVAGQLGRSTTQILQGGTLGQDVNAGFRITLGTWFDPCQNYGVLFRYWNAGQRDDRNGFDSNQFPILARPFRNTSTNPAENDTQLIAFPGNSTGNVSVRGSSDLYGLDVSLRRLLYKDRFTRFDWLYGYQHLSLDEQLAIDSSTTVINLPPLQGSTIAVSDSFRTQNLLHGTSSGFLYNRKFGCWQLETMFRLGLGNLYREVQVQGRTTTTSNAASSTQNQGLLARSTNSRTIVDNTFVISPEVGINLAYAITSAMDFTVGYHYLMVPKVYQAADLIDPGLRVNLSDPPTGALDPALNLSPGRYWVRTLGLGLQVRY